MAKYASLVEETTETEGLLDLVLSGAAQDRRTLASAFAADDWVNYLILDASGAAFERGYGKFNGTTGLTRQFIRESSSAGAKIALSSGTHRVVIGAHPELYVFRGYSLSGAFQTSQTVNTWAKIDRYDDVDLDTDGLLTDPWLSHILPVPEWVDRVRIKGQFSWYNQATPCDKEVRIIFEDALDREPHQPWKGQRDAHENYFDEVFSGSIPRSSDRTKGFQVETKHSDATENARILQGEVSVEFLQ